MENNPKSLIVEIIAENNSLHLLVSEQEDIDILKAFFANVIAKAEKIINHGK